MIAATAARMRPRLVLGMVRPPADRHRLRRRSGDPATDPSGTENSARGSGTVTGQCPIVRSAVTCVVAPEVIVIVSSGAVAARGRRRPGTIADRGRSPRGVHGRVGARRCIAVTTEGAEQRAAAGGERQVDRAVQDAWLQVETRGRRCDDRALRHDVVVDVDGDGVGAGHDAGRAVGAVSRDHADRLRAEEVSDPRREGHPTGAQQVHRCREGAARDGPADRRRGAVERQDAERRGPPGYDRRGAVRRRALPRDVPDGVLPGRETADAERFGAGDRGAGRGAVDVLDDDRGAR